MTYPFVAPCQSPEYNTLPLACRQGKMRQLFPLARQQSPPDTAPAVSMPQS